MPFPIRPVLYLTAGLLGSWLISPRPGLADLVICNQSGEDLSVATMYHKSVNDAWTATGWYNIDNNDCSHILYFDLNEAVYFHAAAGEITTHPLPGDATTSFCVDTEDPFETLWDGDNNNPYYKDLEMGGGFEPCTSIHSDYKEVSFHKVGFAENYYDHCIATENYDHCVVAENHYDHCVVALGPYGAFSWQCFD